MIETRPELENLSDYVPGKSIEEICEQYGLKNAVKLASNENPLGPSKKACEAYTNIVNTLHLYPRGNAPHLISALANKFHVNSDQIVIGNGSDEIIDMVGKAYFRPGDEIIGIRPTFSVYKATALLFGAKFISVEETENRPNLDAYIQAITPKTRAIFICNPNNPTGYYYTESEILEFLSKVPQNILVFIDEAYSEFATAKDYPKLLSQLEKFPNLMLNRTFSKIYGLAGVRVGYAFSSSEVIKALWKVKPPFDVNLAAQAAAEAALSDDDHIQKTLDMNNAGNAQLTKAFTNLGYKVLPTQANFICVHIGEKCLEFVKFLEQNGMIIRYLKSFGMPEWVRITIGQPKENQLLIDLATKWTNA